MPRFAFVLFPFVVSVGLAQEPWSASAPFPMPVAPPVPQPVQPVVDPGATWAASLDPQAGAGVAPLFPGWLGTPTSPGSLPGGGMAMLGGGGGNLGGGCVQCFCDDRVEGEPTCANGYVDVFNGGCNSTPNVFGSVSCGETICGTYGTFLSSTGSSFRDTDWFRFTLPTAANVSWTAIGDVRTRVFIMASSCPASSLGTAVADACLPATLTLTNLAAGTYVAFVATDAFSGVACGSRYRATLTTDPCCVPPCQPGDLIEGETLCANGYVDAFNGGCNSTPSVFGAIDCGQTVCGTYGTFQSSTGSNFRDTDWFRFTLPVATTVTWTAVGQARTRVFVMQGTCPASSLGTAVADACQPATVTLALAAGTYAAFVGTDVFTGVPCGSRYRATLVADPCCVPPCQPGDLLEGESICANGFVDNTNGGCNSTPNVYGAIDCGQTVCGTYGTYQTSTGANFRDTDWYRFTLPAAATVSWTAVGQARTRVFLMQGTCPASSLGTAVADACQPATVTLALAAGTYAAFVGTDVFTGVPCGSRYRATLLVDACCVPPCQPGDQIEGEPLCSAGYVDTTNGGCNRSPNVFGSIRCGETVCGTYGTFVASTGANTRDTDWYRFTLPVATTVTWTAVGQARTRLFLMADICPAQSLGTAVGDACQPVTLTRSLAAGSYLAFVGTDAFTGVPCGSRYRATLITGACVSSGQITSLDTGCGAGGTQTTSGSFTVGAQDFQFMLAGAEPTALLVSVLGFPQPTTSCGPCTYTDAVSVLFRPNLGGAATRPLAIPCTPMLAGVTIDAQWLSFATSTSPCRTLPSLAASNRLRCVLGR